MRTGISYKSDKKIKNIKDSGKYLNELLYLLKNKCKPGVNLLDLEKEAKKFLNERNLTGAFNGYMGFPANLCLSVNECIVHGIPYDYVLKKGDVLKIDCGVIYKKGITDSAITVVIGGEEANFQGAELVRATKKALDDSLQFLGDGQPFFNYSLNVYNIVVNNGFSVIKNLTGHGVGDNVHEEPIVFNVPNKDTKKTFFREGMVLALEPITAEVSDTFVLRSGNNWHLYTPKNDLSAQREYDVLITSNGYEFLAGIDND